MNKVLKVCLSLIFCFVSMDLIADEVSNENGSTRIRKGFEPYSVAGLKISSKTVRYLEIAYWKDKTTNLFWTNGETKKEAVYRTWDDAQRYCSNIKYGNKVNWRLATKEELEQVSSSGIYVLNKINGIGNLDSWFWSSTGIDDEYAWLVFVKSGVSSYIPKSSESYGVLCVHSY